MKKAKYSKQFAAEEKKTCKELNKKQNAIFNNFMEENYPIAYKLNQMSYEIKKK